MRFPFSSEHRQAPPPPRTFRQAHWRSISRLASWKFIAARDAGHTRSPFRMWPKFPSWSPQAAKRRLVPIGCERRIDPPPKPFETNRLGDGSGLCRVPPLELKESWLGDSSSRAGFRRVAVTCVGNAIPNESSLLDRRDITSLHRDPRTRSLAIRLRIAKIGNSTHGGF